MNAIYKIMGLLYARFVQVISVLPQSVRPFLYYTPWKLFSTFLHHSSKKTAKKNSETPTCKMLESRDFFRENTDRVDKVASYFIDDASRDCYYKMIDFRCNSHVSNFPSVSKVQYFDNEYFKYSENEVFVDCGAYNGVTIMYFKHMLKKLKKHAKKIVAFEPGEKYDILTSAHNDLEVLKAGVWSKNDTLHFCEFGATSVVFDKNLAPPHERPDPVTGSEEPSRIVSIPVRSIDSCTECEGVTFLKMDIEGAEMDALKGAINTIAKYKPKLAICIYHSDEDMIKIPEWVHENFPEYKMFVRHHLKFSIFETVLYGFVE